MPLYEKIRYYGGVLDEKYSPYVDKIEAKRIVANLTQDNIKTAEIVKILDSQEPWKDFVETDIRGELLLKPSHASGWNTDLSDITNLDVIRGRIQEYNRTYSTTERQYQSIPPRFFLERKIRDKYLGETGKAIVYMVRCIHGTPVSVGVKWDDSSVLYTTDWRPILTYGRAFPRPSALGKMIHYAALLSEPFEFVRVDFYIDNKDELYFSEFTFTPNGGCRTFPMAIEHYFGRMWR